MCGIAGIHALPGTLSGVRKELELMIHTLHHRGPDGYGFYVDDPVGLAHARLSIIDLATGDQPICNEDRTVWTVFNGEIFNYVELRADLERAGHVFRTHSDTETIVHAYEEYGDDFAKRLNGQFAIALWDSRQQRLLLIRDRLGIRPLFWKQERGRLLFGSEIKAILAVSERGGELDLKGLAETFTFWTPVGERTSVRDVSMVPPGHMLVVDSRGQRLHSYWEWAHPSREDTRRVSLEQAAEELTALLLDAVRLQLRADVPVGAYLSGGLDSSIIASLIKREPGVPLRTFSVTFEDAEFDETPFQQAMVRHLGTEHTSVMCRRSDIGAAFPRLIRHTEATILRTAPAPLMILSGHVRQSGFKVVLTGEGADEVFGGYDLFKEAKIRRFWARSPESDWRHQLFRRLYPYLKHSPVSGGAFSHFFFGQGLQDTASLDYAHRQRWSTTRRLWNFLSAEVRTELGDFSPEEELRAQLPQGIGRWDGLSRDQCIEANTLLYGYLLSSQGDRVAMANSVEGRVPFLDHRVVEFANSLPANYKLRGLNEKAILRRAVGHHLPKEIATRVKQPYRAPDSQSFFDNGKPLDYVDELFSPGSLASAGLFDVNAARKLFEKCRTGRAIGFGDNMAFVGILSAMLLKANLSHGSGVS